MSEKSASPRTSRRRTQDALRYQYLRKHGLYDAYLKCCESTEVYDTGDDLDKVVDTLRRRK